MAYLNPADIDVRQQNIGVLEGEKGRVMQEQIAAIQDATNRAYLAQQAKQFREELDAQKAAAADAAAEAEKNRWFGLGQSVAGAIPGFGTLAAYLTKNK